MSLPPFQALLDSHRADVYRFLLASVGPNEADDCFQETWIAALRAYPRLKHGDNLRGWLLKIAQNKALDAHRARGRRAVPVEQVPDRGAGDPGIAAAQAENPGLWARVRGAAGEAAPGRRAPHGARHGLPGAGRGPRLLGGRGTPQRARGPQDD